MVKYFVLFAAISAGISGVWFHGFGQGEKANQLQINSLNAQIATGERAKQKVIDDVLQSQGVRIADINRQHAIDIARMRDRPDRVRAPTVVSPGPECAGRTGADLSRPDAEFLIGEAARADTIRAGLIACYAAYDALN